LCKLIWNDFYCVNKRNLDGKGVFDEKSQKNFDSIKLSKKREENQRVSP
jgi:hypothetical protein